MSDLQNAVVMHIDTDGSSSLLVCGAESVRVFVIDERAPNDRVYEITGRDTAEEIKDALGDSPIGHAGDDRHEAISNRINAELDGRNRFSIVESEAQSND